MKFWQRIKKCGKPKSASEVVRACHILNDIKKRHNRVCGFIRTVAKPVSSCDGLSTESTFDRWDAEKVYPHTSIVHYKGRNYISKRTVCGVPPNYNVDGTMTDPFWEDLVFFLAPWRILGEEE